MGIDKIIEVDANIKIWVVIEKANIGYSSSYEMAEFRDGELDRTISFIQCDDYKFQTFCLSSNIDEINRIDFNIEKDNPFYNSINKFLDKEDSIIIDDDGTREINKKTLQFLRSGEIIIISFFNELGKNETGKFNIFVKSILTDLRSKIDDGNLDTKDRLCRLFESFRAEFCPETLEEYPIKSDELIMQRTYTMKLRPNNGK